MLRLTFPVPTWEDYLALSFDEIRQYGATSVQVVRRLRAALVGLADTIAVEARREAVRGYLDHLNLGVGRLHSMIRTRLRHRRKTARAWAYPAGRLSPRVKLSPRTPIQVHAQLPHGMQQQCVK